MSNYESSYMRLGALALGATLALGACAKRDNAATDTAAVMTAPATTDTAMAGAATTPATGSATALGNLNDANIMSLISMSNANEIGTSKLAETKATSADVKSFARDMIRDHTAMQGEADRLAKQINVTPEAPSGVGDDMKRMATAMADSLKAATKGSAFDTQYVNGQVQAHQQTLDQLQQFQNMTQNAQLKDLVTKAIPKVQQHLDRAKQLQTSVGTRT